MTTHEKKMVLTEPLGLLYVASYLEDRMGDAVNIQILDLFALGYDQIKPKGDMWIKGLSDEQEILRRVGEFNPDILGVHSNFTAYAEDSLEIAKMVKDALPNVYIVMGGAHVTMEAEAVMEQNPFIDCIVRGEGEVTFHELVKSLMKERGMLSASD